MAKIVAHLGSDDVAGTRIDDYEPTARQLAEYAGDYYSDELDSVWHLVEIDGVLELHVGYSSEFELQFTSEDAFAADRFSGTFERDETGAVTEVVIDAGRVKNLRAVKHTGSGNG